MSVRVCWNLDCPQAGYLIEMLGDDAFACKECGGETEPESQLSAAELGAAKRKRLYAETVTAEEP